MRTDSEPAGQGAGLPLDKRPNGQLVLSGALWNYSAAIAASFIQLGYTAYTGRTVSAAAFGAFASALSIAQLMGYFANAGLANTVLCSSKLSRDLLMATLRLGMLSGILSFAVVEATAPLWAELWNAPQAGALLRLLGCQFLVLPAAAVSTAGLRRLLEQRAAVLVEIAAQFAGLLTGALLLANGWNPMGLAAAPVATQLCVAVLAGALVARRLPPGGGRPTGRPVCLRELAGTSGFVAAHQLAQYVTNTVPLWAVGALIGPAAAGYYSRATLFTGLLLTMLAAGLTRVTTPALTRVRTNTLRGDGTSGSHANEGHATHVPAPQRNEPPAFRRAVTDVLLVASALSFMPFAFLAGIGPDALMLLLGPEWTTAARLVPLLCVFSAAALVYAVALSVDTVCGSHRRLAVAQATVAAVTGAGALVAGAGDSLMLMSVSALAGQLGGHAVQMWKWGENVVERRRLRVGYGVHAALGLVLYAAGVAVSQVASGRSSPATWLMLLSVALVAALCCLLRRHLPLYQIMAARGLFPTCRRSWGSIISGLGRGHRNPSVKFRPFPDRLRGEKPHRTGASGRSGDR
ncbi:oligosaccharide flippase family protein [Streptomyces sp. NPDC059909]|uniref:oligosaccharide flippase family protein n=1 Tax=Streptomyces sp. NPDC059909 TaxID=3346998 RepID=UPI00366723CD